MPAHELERRGDLYSLLEEQNEEGALELLERPQSQIFYTYSEDVTWEGFQPGDTGWDVLPPLVWIVLFLRSRGGFVRRHVPRILQILVRETPVEFFARAIMTDFFTVIAPYPVIIANIFAAATVEKLTALPPRRIHYFIGRSLWDHLVMASGQHSQREMLSEDFFLIMIRIMERFPQLVDLRSIRLFLTSSGEFADADFVYAMVSIGRSERLRLSAKRDSDLMTAAMRTQNLRIVQVVSDIQLDEEKEFSIAVTHSELEAYLKVEQTFCAHAEIAFFRQALKILTGEYAHTGLSKGAMLVI